MGVGDDSLKAGHGENQHQHQRSPPPPYSSWAASRVLWVGEMNNYEVLTGKDELLFVLEITGACGKKTKGEME